MEDTLKLTLSEIKQYLREYLELHNIEINHSGAFCCLNPNHDDSNPSMSFVPSTDDTKAHCFGCGANYDIFDAANILEGLPASGSEFITVTVTALAKKFNVPFTIENLDLSEEKIVQYRYKKLYRDVFETLKEISTNAHTQARGWNDAFCKKHGIGSVDWNEFKRILTERFLYSEEELSEKDIKPDLFSSHKITFTIFDHHGAPVGFTARNTKFDKRDKSTYPKYRNTSGHVPIYQKGSILYGLHVVESIRGAKDRIDVFEGHPDWVSAQINGVKNCVALCGTALSEGHIKLLKDLGYKQINIILDGDSAGDKATSSIVSKFCVHFSDIRFTVMELDYPITLVGADRDPDNYFKHRTIEDYNKLVPVSTFEWALKKQVSEIKESLVNEGIEREEVETSWKSLAKNELSNLAKSMIHHLFAEPSPMEQGKMAQVLSEYSGVKEADIREEVKARSNKQILQIADSLVNKLRRNPDSIEVIELIKSAGQRIDLATTKKNISAFSHEDVTNDLDSFYNEADNSDVSTVGWKTGWDFIDNPENFGGIHKKEAIYFLAGAPNFGKSAILVNIARRLLLPQNTDHNNDMCLMVSYLDDATSVFWGKLLASMTGESYLDVRYPSRSIYKDRDRTINYKRWRDYIRHLVNERSLLVKGHKIGSDIKAFEYWIKHAQDTTGKDIVFLVDAFHDITIDPEVMTVDQNARFIEICDWMQRTTEELSYSVLTCAHITKGGIARGRPEQTDILNTGKMQFSAKVIGLVYSDLDYAKAMNRTKADVYWEIPNPGQDQDSKRPIVELNISKNKLSGYKGHLYFKHLSEACHMELISPEEKRRYEAIVQASRANELENYKANEDELEAY